MKCLEQVLTEVEERRNIMIKINELQVGNWVEFMGQKKQVSRIIEKKDSVVLQGCNIPVKCKDIEPIVVDTEQDADFIIERLLKLPNGKDAINFIIDNRMWHLHEIQNSCKHAAKIDLK